MYLKKIEIKNIKSISNCHIEFKDGNQAGWHVLLGDNGAGKSTITKAVTVALLGEENTTALSTFEDFVAWVGENGEHASIEVTFIRDNEYDKPVYNSSKTGKTSLKIEDTFFNIGNSIEFKLNPQNALWGKNVGTGWFFAAYGPFRRFRGGSDVFAHTAISRPRLGATMSIFRDDFALTQLSSWLKDLALDATKKPAAKQTLSSIINFINNSKLLPYESKLSNNIDSEGLKLEYRNGTITSMSEMSDGYKSILSLTLDILRYMLAVFEPNRVFLNGTRSITLPGVIIIDEVDAHLHPTWQTRIGQWFTEYFPNIQFIVTTHSPLICRASEKGTIWKLPAPSTNQVIKQITGDEKDSLVYGDILDAFDTNIFGDNIARGNEGKQKHERYRELVYKERYGENMSASEQGELKHLKKVFHTNVTANQ